MDAKIISNDNFKDHTIHNTDFSNHLIDNTINYINKNGKFTFKEEYQFTRCIQYNDKNIFIPAKNGFARNGFARNGFASNGFACKGFIVIDR